MSKVYICKILKINLFFKCFKIITTIFTLWHGVWLIGGEEML